jgi:GGDEF domain-containing protein
MAGTGRVIVGGQGTAAGAQVYFLMYALLPAMFYPVSEWRSSLLLGVLNLVVFGYLHTEGWPAQPDLAAMTPQALKQLQTSFIQGCALVVAGVVALSEHTADANEQRLLQLARTDPLTGLPNRRAFREWLSAETNRAQRQHPALSVAILDMDHFKAVNDTVGHEGGDAALRHVAAQAFRVGGRDLHITFSAGVLQVAPTMNEDQVLHAADAALFRAKHGGRNRVVAAAA